MKTLITLFICLQTLVVFSQNLVPNPSFEEYDECPTEVGQINHVTGWHAALETPDYYNECSPSTNVNNTAIDVPTNNAGFQNAATGNAYLGLFSFFIVDDYREYVQCQLASPMEVGITYYFSMKCSRAEGFGIPYDHYNLATNNLGVLFNTELFDNQINPLITPNTSHINFDQVVLDTNNWVTLNGQFTADQAYSYMSLGNFYDSSYTVIVGTEPSAVEYPYGAYYLIDDVCLSANPFCSVDSTVGSEASLVDIKLISSEKIILKSKVYGELCVVNTLGSKILIQDLTPTDVSIDFTDLPVGIVFLIIKTKNRNSIFKFFINQ